MYIYYLTAPFMSSDVIRILLSSSCVKCNKVLSLSSFCVSSALYLVYSIYSVWDKRWRNSTHTVVPTYCHLPLVIMQVF